jgi:predicted O-methyltransferase YrrM
MRVAAHYLAWSLGLAPAETQTTDRERDCLALHASGRRRLAEIGVWHGVTTARLREVMDPSGELSAIDPYPAGRLRLSLQERIAHHVVDRVEGGRVRWLKMNSVEAARDHHPIDFLFIDGDHTEAGLLADWNAWSGLVEPGGVVALHDSRSTPGRRIEDAGSVIVTNRVILRDSRFEGIEAVDSLTVLRRR